MAKKLTGEEDSSGEILRQLEDAPLQRELQPGVVVDLENPGDYDSEAMKIKVLANVEAALLKQVATVSLVTDLHCTYKCAVVERRLVVNGAFSLWSTELAH